LRVPVSWFVLLFASWLGAEGLNQAWYGWHERGLTSASPWTLRWPVPRAGFKQEDIDDEARTYLRYDTGYHGAWQDRYQWDLYFFTWNPSRTAAGLAQRHHPDICLPAAGFLLKEQLAAQKMEFNSVTIPITRYVFQDPLDGHYLYVFQAVSDDRVRTGPSGIESPIELGRLSAAWQGVRNPGQRSFLVVVQGVADLPQAESGTRALLQDTLRLAPSEAQ
jgi:hypothetical protein